MLSRTQCSALAVAVALCGSHFMPTFAVKLKGAVGNVLQIAVDMQSERSEQHPHAPEDEKNRKTTVYTGVEADDIKSELQSPESPLAVFGSQQSEISVAQAKVEEADSVAQTKSKEEDFIDKTSSGMEIVSSRACDKKQLQKWLNGVKVNCEVKFGEQIKRLDLYNKKLQSLPADFVGKLTSQLTNLETLQLQNNKLTSLPADFGKLTTLNWLDVHGNKLTELPAGFEKLTNLKTLHLRGNKLTSLPADFGNLIKLEGVNLGRNQLTSLPVNFGKLTNLHWVALSGNNLTELPADFGKLTNLKTLDLDHNELTSLPADFGKLTNLEQLNLAGNKLASLPADFGKLTKLKTLDLRKNKNLKATPDLKDQLRDFLDPLSLRSLHVDRELRKGIANNEETFRLSFS